ncbi:FecR protein [mine drainage metagenome]|uniref:FecR protein n=1 Tax=mine drainage metagenome TaxID=410659 RepID=A0A1J5RWI5_9ZZZZ
MNRVRISAVASFFLLLLWSCLAFAAATTEAISGDVLLAPANGEYASLAYGERVDSGATIKTGANGRVVLRFDDGQKVSISESSLFVVNEYKFNPHKPAQSSFIVSLLKGGLRAVTGVIGETNKRNVVFKSPVATVGIRGTDFQLYFDNKLYINVLSGAISATNDGGTTVFDAKTQPTGQVIDAQTKALPAPASIFPAAAQGAFRLQQQQPLMGPVKEPNPRDPNCKDRS